MDASPASLKILRNNGYKFVKRFTGPQGSGKTTQAMALQDKLIADGKHAVIVEEIGADVVYAK